MNYLQYTSKEMISATQLIRKSKSVFNLLSSSEIEKAVILRDGKPSFILLDFEKYELFMHEYIKMKEESRNKILEKETLKKEIKEDINKGKSLITEIKNEEDNDSLKDFWE